MPGTWFEALIVAGIAILLWQPGLSWRRTVAAGVVLGTSATVAQVGEALIPAAAIFVLAAAAASWRRAHRQGRSPVRGLRAAHPGLLRRVLPGRRGLLPVPPGRHVGLRQDGLRRRLRHHQAAAR